MLAASFPRASLLSSCCFSSSTVCAVILLLLLIPSLLCGCSEFEDELHCLFNDDNADKLILRIR